MMSFYKIYLLSILSGILSALSQPLVISFFSEKELLNPFAAGFLAWISFVPLMIVMRNLEPRKAFISGLISGVVYFAIVLYWIDIAMNVFGHMPQYLAVPVLFILVLYCALYWAFWAYISVYIYRSVGLDISIIAPFIFVALEYLRNYFLTGFPWGNIAYSQYKNLIFIQVAAIGGIYIVQYVVLLINAVTERWARFFFNRNESKPIRYSIFLLVIISFVYVYGMIRANGINYNMANAEKLKVTLLQGNIDQGIKKRSAEFRGSILSNYLDLLRQAESTGADIVIWPEAAYPVTLPDGISSFAEPDALLDKKMFPFIQIIGISTYSYEDGRRVLHNGSFLLDRELSVRGRYYKSHLVPFGEYVPLGIPIEKFVSGVGTFIPGNVIEPLKIEDGKREMRAGILICYEGIFPEISREHSKNGANLLINLTNDAWYGISSAPYQHLSMYVFRSIENGKYVARVANTGITAIINPYGKIEKETEIFVRGILSGEVSLINEGSLYTKIGDIFALLCSLIAIISSIVSIVISRKKVMR